MGGCNHQEVKEIMAKEFVKFDHHGAEVSADAELKGKHREHCLCFDCKAFTPEDRENNCKIANVLFNLCKLAEVTTPVMYCKEFVHEPNKIIHV